MEVFLGRLRGHFKLLDDIEPLPLRSTLGGFLLWLDTSAFRSLRFSSRRAYTYSRTRPEGPSLLCLTVLNPSAVRGKLRQRTVSLYRSMSYGLFCPGTI